jgi:sugar lactone lactonase YvrE
MVTILRFTITTPWIRTRFRRAGIGLSWKDKRGFIWMTTTTQGIFSLDPMTEKFTRYYHQPGTTIRSQAKLANGNMAMDSSGTIWICTLNGLNSFDPVRNKFDIFIIARMTPPASAQNLIYCFAPMMKTICGSWLRTTIDVFSISEKKK